MVAPETHVYRKGLNIQGAVISYKVQPIFVSLNPFAEVCQICP